MEVREARVSAGERSGEAGVWGVRGEAEAGVKGKGLGKEDLVESASECRECEAREWMEWEVTEVESRLEAATDEEEVLESVRACSATGAEEVRTASSAGPSSAAKVSMPTAEGN